MASVYLRPSAEFIQTGPEPYGSTCDRMANIAGISASEFERHGVTANVGFADIDTGTAVAEANVLQPDLYISIRMAHAECGQSGGRVYYRIPSGQAAEDMTTAMNTVTPTETILAPEENYSCNRGNFYELRNVTVPALVVDVGFINNAADNLFVSENMYEIAVAISKGGLAYLGIEYILPPPEHEAALRAQYNTPKS